MSDAPIRELAVSGLHTPNPANTPWLTVHLEHRFHNDGAGFHLHLAFAAHAQRTVVFGPSGSGKSSLLRAIAGLLKPDMATIQFHGTTVCKTTQDSHPRIFIPAEKRRVGLVMQNPAVFPHLTAAGNVAFALRGTEKSAQQKTVARLLEVAEAESLADRWPRELSGGQLQRVAIARTLAAGPSILLLDEPFAALDAQSRQQVSQNLHQWSRERGVPVLTVTHNLEEAFAAGDEVLTMEDGRITAQGAPERVLFHHRERLLHLLHATPAAGSVDILCKE
ncbi:MAG: ATP-binding cassette domain-containing protein [Acidobacteriaceae bacterium]